MGYPQVAIFPPIDAIQIERSRHRPRGAAVLNEVRFFQMKFVRDDSHRVIRTDHLTRLQSYSPPGTLMNVYQVFPTSALSRCVHL